MSQVFLEQNQIEFEIHKGFEWLISPDGYKMYVDFFLTKYNLVIEYDGEQHFQPNEYFGGESELNYRKQCDEIKNDYCRKHHIPLIRIKYSELHLCNENTIFSSFFIS